MAHSYHEIAFTPSIRDLQVDAGSREAYASMAGDGRFADELTLRETDFIARRDSFYMASVSETGWPYVQHRGGPTGFMKVLDSKTIGFVDYLFFMDYPNKRRLKMFGRARLVDTSERDTLEKLEDLEYPVQIERAVVITVEGFDWNCPAHITPRYSESEMAAVLAELTEENHRLQARLAVGGANALVADAANVLGDGGLELVISGIRQLTERVRAYELRDPEGRDLPPVGPGSHLRIPVRLAGGEASERHYSIASNPERRDIYEIAVQRKDQGSGGSRAVHAGFELGMRLRVDPPANHFSLHTDERAAVLIAGGIGITPIKAMAQALEARGANFHLHYAGRDRRQMAFRDRLERHLGKRISVYSKADGDCLELESVLAAAPADAVIYVCGPDRMISGVVAAAKKAGISRDRIRMERFS